MDKPTTLYRGMKLTREEFDSYNLNGNLKLPPDYDFNDAGMKVVSDGNEYGIYMSTNKEMALNYGDTELHDAQPIGNRVVVGMSRTPVGMPKIGLVMEIDTTGLSIKEPYINPVMMGHYNNGYEGKEWISTEDIPSTNISYAKVSIGPDLLHDKKEYVAESPSKAKSLVNEELGQREQSLTKLHDFLEKESPRQLLNMNFSDYKDSFEKMFNDNCLEEKSFDVNSKDGIKSFLLAGINSEEELTLKDVREVNYLSDRLGSDAPMKDAALYVRERSETSAFYQKADSFVRGYTSFSYQMDKVDYEADSREFKRILLENGMKDKGKEILDIYVSTKTSDTYDGREDKKRAFKETWDNKYKDDAKERLPWHKDDLRIKDRDFEHLEITGHMKQEVTRELLRTVIENPEYNTRHELVKRAGAIASCLSAH